MPSTVGCATLAFCDAQGDLISAIRFGRGPEAKKRTLKETLRNSRATSVIAIRARPDQVALGVGVQSRPPFRSLTVDRADIPYGARDDDPELDGVQLPSSYGVVCDGCFGADVTASVASARWP
jgi:hypothetical protein